MIPESLRALPDRARRLLAEARVGRLGLLDDSDHPRVLPVTFVLWEEALWSAIDRKPKRREPARLRYLERRPEASLTVDRYDEDWARLAWVQVLGAVAIIDASAAGDALTALTAKYPQYRDRPPPGPVLRLAPLRALWWEASETPSDA
jgi:PPOX class probable F420-dependent enzyme